MTTNRVLVVSWLYSTNGMGSWCWEAAHALAEAGEHVILVCSPEVRLPGNPVVPICRFAPTTEAHRRGGLGGLVGRLCARSSGFVGDLDRRLREQGYQPAMYLLNQSNLQDPRVATPQHVVAWAYPVSLPAYLAKVPVMAGWRPSKSMLIHLLDAVGWWRKDWRAYRAATSTLAVSQRLADSLKRSRVRASAVYPGTNLGGSAVLPPEVQPALPVRVLVAALDLEERRKGIRPILASLQDAQPADPFEVTLVGQASPAFRQWVAAMPFPSRFTGRIDREALQGEMARHDIFLFGSHLDDWGYVLIEAMAAGMVIVAPNLSPFDEIVGDAGSHFEPGDAAGRRACLRRCVAPVPAARKAEIRERAHRLFSRRAFARSLTRAASDWALL